MVGFIEVAVVMILIWGAVIAFFVLLYRSKRQERMRVRETQREERLAKDRTREELARARESQRRYAALPVVDCHPGFQHDTNAERVIHDHHNPASFVKVQQIEEGKGFRINMTRSYCSRCGLQEDKEFYKPYQ
jgi:hypothetical protein